MSSLAERRHAQSFDFPVHSPIQALTHPMIKAELRACEVYAGTHGALQRVREQESLSPV